MFIGQSTVWVQICKASAMVIPIAPPNSVAKPSLLGGRPIASSIPCTGNGVCTSSIWKSLARSCSTAVIA